MQEQLRKLKDVNRNLRKEIRQRMGDCLNELSFEELQGLEQEMDNAAKIIRERKCRNVEEIHKGLLHELDAIKEDPYGLVDNGGDYDAIIGYQHGGPRIFALRLQPTHVTHPSLHSGGGSDLTTYPLLE
ncbi:Transcription factor, K-box [Corchorus olitorius]|uniref:Transcription factor, K-box n=1 Tax=Corchorus olitorius TaxID=93759 RepID=A0A1R3HYA6_9ROSI|nr:Transcription factor, K-box [Corchorus olitorius]